MFQRAKKLTLHYPNCQPCRPSGLQVMPTLPAIENLDNGIRRQAEIVVDVRYWVRTTGQASSGTRRARLRLDSTHDTNPNDISNPVEGSGIG